VGRAAAPSADLSAYQGANLFFARLAGVDGLVTIMKGGDARRAFFRRGIHRFKEDFKPKVFVLLYHLRQARLIDGESLLPAFFSEFFFSTHIVNDERWAVNYKELSTDF